MADYVLLMFGSTRSCKITGLPVRRFQSLSCTHWTHVSANRFVQDGSCKNMTCASSCFVFAGSSWNMPSPRMVDGDNFQQVKESEACKILAEDARLNHHYRSLATMAAPDFQCCSKVIMLCQSSTMMSIEICKPPVKSTIRTEFVALQTWGAHVQRMFTSVPFV